MGIHIKIKRGKNINLIGESEKTLVETNSDVYALSPTDAHGMTPKLLKKEGEEVKAGEAVYFEKTDERIKFVSPVKGEIAQVIRGEKRKILEVRILADKQQSEVKISAPALNDLTEDTAKELLFNNGFWPFIKQRPYDVIANPDVAPKAIFISAFSSAPLAADNNFALNGRAGDLQAGIDLLTKLTKGKVHVNVSGAQKSGSVFSGLKNCELNTVSGPHPAGNVGVQIHHIAPINKGEIVWTVNPQDVAAIGAMFTKGVLDLERVVALCGAEAKTRQYHKVRIGSSVKPLLDNNLASDNVRVISGDVLTGNQISADGFVGLYHSSITVIPEGDFPQFFGWLTPNFHKLSFSRLMWSWLTPNKKYNLNTSYNGEDRAFVMTGEYEKVFPFDILPQHLVKAMMVKDIELMENLGVYEIAPEDFALCEFACTSKMELQQEVRKGLDLMIKEVG